MTSPKTYDVRTHGCQMNVHDSERLTGLLEGAGYVPAPAGSDASRGEVDVVVFNTCAVRENADNKLYGNLGQLRPLKQRNPDLQIAVGGCLAQKDRDSVLRKAPWVDVVFGTHNLGSLPALLDRARSEGVRVVTTYGMSETAGGCVYNGQPLQGVAVRTDAAGALEIGGPVVAHGYLGVETGAFRD